MTTPIIKTASISDELRSLPSWLGVRRGAATCGLGPIRTNTSSTSRCSQRSWEARRSTHDSAFYTDGYAGAALWLPPDVQPDDDALTALMQRTSAAPLEDVSAVFEQMERYHPREPHWYLPFIGVDPSQQGEGYGAALMKHSPRPPAIATTHRHISSPATRRTSLSMSGTGSSCWARSRWGHRRPSSPWCADHGDLSADG